MAEPQADAGPTGQPDADAGVPSGGDAGWVLDPPGTPTNGASGTGPSGCESGQPVSPAWPLAFVVALLLAVSRRRTGWRYLPASRAFERV